MHEQFPVVSEDKYVDSGNVIYIYINRKIKYFAPINARDEIKRSLTFCETCFFEWWLRENRSMSLVCTVNDAKASWLA